MIPTLFMVLVGNEAFENGSRTRVEPTLHVVQREGRRHDSAPDALFELSDAKWELEKLFGRGWLTRVPWIDTATGMVPWKGEALRMLRRESRFRTAQLKLLKRSAWVLRTHPGAVGKRLGDLSKGVPLIEAYDREGRLRAYCTRTSPWRFVALPRRG
jgi:hypothetical protein